MRNRLFISLHLLGHGARDTALGWCFRVGGCLCGTKQESAITAEREKRALKLKCLRNCHSNLVFMQASMDNKGILFLQIA